MKFYDQTTFTITSGNGGDGCATGRKESRIAFGGPSGGDGGRGGDVVFRASKDLNTLEHLRYHHEYGADDGEPGRGKDQYGAKGENITIRVPIGTLVWQQDGGLLQEFTHDGQERTALRGGIGGAGNIHFKNSTRQYPDFALLGEPGTSLDLKLELQLLADVGLIGAPSVGKSTLLNTVTARTVKTAEYHFTTLIPHLGVVSVQDQSFTLIDIPGLIQGATEGKGLGGEFLRHVLKCQTFALLIDASKYEAGVQDALTIWQEVETYMTKKYTDMMDEDAFHITYTWREETPVIQVRQKKEGKDDLLISQKYVHIVMTKTDLINDVSILQELEKYAKKKFSALWETSQKTPHDIPLYQLSAPTHEGIHTRKQYCMRIVTVAKQQQCVGIEALIDDEKPKNIELTGSESENFLCQDVTSERFEMLCEEGYIDRAKSEHIKIWHLQDPTVTRLVYMLPRGNQEAEDRFRTTMQREKVMRHFEQAGGRFGDIRYIANPYKKYGDRYIEVRA